MGRAGNAGVASRCPISAELRVLLVVSLLVAVPRRGPRLEMLALLVVEALALRSWSSGRGTGRGRAALPARSPRAPSPLPALTLEEERQRRPERIVLIRHGQSEGNTDRVAYSKTPDSQIALTDRGWAQASVAGLQLRELVGDESVRFFYSPYTRARQTMLAMLQAFEGRPVEISQEPRLREQDFGNFQDPETMEDVMAQRQEFGRFYFRFPNGEAGTDVFDRVASFITYLFRSMAGEGYFERKGDDDIPPARNYVIVTHGLLMRIFCMCYFRWTVMEFEQVWNPSNCEMWVLQKVEGTGIYGLGGRWRASPYGGNFTDIKFGRNRNEKVHDHMKTPTVSRVVTPGKEGALDGVEHAHLRDLSQRLSQRGESVLEYWRRTGRDLIQVSVDDGPDGPRAAQGGWRATASGRQLDRPPTTERDSLS